MEKSYSLLSSDHLNLLDDLNSKKDKFSSIHCDLTDNYFCETLGLSILTLEQLANKTEYDIDVHLLVKNPKYVLERIKNLNINRFIFHLETISAKELSELNIKKTVALLPDTNIKKLEEYLEVVDSVLFLCISPSLFPKEPPIDPVERVKKFNEYFPAFEGKLMVDGGLKESDLNKLEKLGVFSVVLGKDFFE